MKKARKDIKNIAIIAHVDHGKTTLVDQLLKQSGIFRKNQVVEERIMDSNDIERERGITILSKNTAISYKDIKINIIDTPGHADFGGEVERILKMVDGVVLLVDAFEGPMPQTKFVLKNALKLKLPAIVCVNKIDRQDARPDEVIDQVIDLFIDLDANEEQLDCPFVYTSAKNGIASLDSDKEGEDMKPLLDTIINHIPSPIGDFTGPTQVLISTIDYDNYVGRIGVGKVERGTIKINQEVIMVNEQNKDLSRKIKVTKLLEFEGLNRVEVKEAFVGSIVAIMGIEGIQIGDTICHIDHPEPLPFIKISQPTISMDFSVNDSPFAGQEGEYVTSRQLRDRLFNELLSDVSLKVEETDSPDTFKVSGRGELHLSILIENMRREGYEFQVSKPEVLYKIINDKTNEPMEIVTIDVPEEYTGSIIESLTSRRGELLNLSHFKGGYSRLEFSIPTRGLIGYRSRFMTETKGSGVLNSIFDGYGLYKGEILTRSHGSIIATEGGEAVVYGMYNAQERGVLFINPGTRVYEGMVVGENARKEDIEINICRKKQLTNVRASGSDDALRLSTPDILSLEEALEFINNDELVEITPQNIRIRKRILNTTMRKKASSKK